MVPAVFGREWAELDAASRPTAYHVPGDARQPRTRPPIARPTPAFVVTPSNRRRCLHFAPGRSGADRSSSLHEGSQDVAGNKRPSFLKRQKEQKRLARAAEKRDARRLKKQNTVTSVEDQGDPNIELEGIETEEVPQDAVEEDTP